MAFTYSLYSKFSFGEVYRRFYGRKFCFTEILACMPLTNIALMHDLLESGHESADNI